MQETTSRVARERAKEHLGLPYDTPVSNLVL